MTTSTERQPSPSPRVPAVAQPSAAAQAPTATRLPTATPAVDTPAAGHLLAEGPALSRVAGLPAADVAPLAAEQVAEVLDRIAAARRELAALAPAVTGLLYDAVPLMPTTGARRSVLRWRRAAHAGRPDPVAPELFALVREALAPMPRDTSALERWVERAGALAGLRQLLRLRAGAAEPAEERTLRHLMGLPAVSGALALVSPVFSRRVRQPGGRPLDRGERLTAYGYAVRSALKASPLSSLTHVAVPGADHGARVRVSLHPLVGRVLLRAAAVRDGVRGLVRWRVNGSLRAAGPTARLSEPRQSVTDGWAWSDDEVLDAGGREDLFAALRDPRGLPAVRLARYLEAGLLDIDDPCPQDRLLDWVAAALAASPDPSDRRAAGRLLTATGELATIAGGGPAARAAGLARLREALEETLDALGAADDWPLREVTLVYEDRAGTLPARPGTTSGPRFCGAMPGPRATACGCLPSTRRSPTRSWRGSARTVSATTCSASFRSWPLSESPAGPQSPASPGAPPGAVLPVAPKTPGPLSVPPPARPAPPVRGGRVACPRSPSSTRTARSTTTARSSSSTRSRRVREGWSPASTGCTSPPGARAGRASPNGSAPGCARCIRTPSAWSSSRPARSIPCRGTAAVSSPRRCTGPPRRAGPVRAYRWRSWNWRTTAG
ncbi:hypothetical protein [Streptomyces sp. I6]|uniref:hypothetical protein n=1 Tax=Streptomyces sp. I6 TaxID=2483113 RepID=UPI002880AC06|nr:hypothetical protein [Streptomyces sp. I6]